MKLLQIENLNLYYKKLGKKHYILKRRYHQSIKGKYKYIKTENR